MTLSGGEPLLQTEFARAVLRECRREGIHTAIETTLCYPWARIGDVIEWVDLVMFDVKFFDEQRHTHYTGGSNRRLMENLPQLDRCGKPLIARTPVIADINDSEEEIAQIARLLAPLDNLLHYELLPCHSLGSGKYIAQGRQPPAFSAPTPEKLNHLSAIARAENLRVIAHAPLAPRPSSSNPPAASQS